MTTPYGFTYGVGRLRTMESAALILMQIVLMARACTLQGSVEHPRRVRWHRTLGCASFLMMIDHFLLATPMPITAARKKLTNGGWHLIHLYAYLGAGFALAHQLWSGSSFTANQVATLFWFTA